MVLTAAWGLAALGGCLPVAAIGGNAAARSVDPKAPKAETEANCKDWECWDGYACGSCEKSSE